jgi:ParB-like chromosome segregation protein Spo0J
MSPDSPAKLEPHPLSALLPMMSDQELRKLRADILKNGQQEPIVLFEGKILDGRNRYRACMDLGIVDPKKEDFAGKPEDALHYVMARNVHRRQLSASQKAVVALNCLPLIQEETERARIEKIRATIDAKKGMGELLPSSPRKLKSTDLAGAIVGVSGRYVADAQLLQKKAPDLLDKVFARAIPLSKAVRKYKTTAGAKRGPKAKPLQGELKALMLKLEGKPSVVKHLEKALEELVRLEAKG